MRASPIITKVDVVTFEHAILEVGKDYNRFNMVYEPGGSVTQRGGILRIHTDQGIVGEYGYLIGKDALAREPIYNDLKRLHATGHVGSGIDRHLPLGPRRQVLRRAALSASRWRKTTSKGVRLYASRR